MAGLIKPLISGAIEIKYTTFKDWGLLKETGITGEKRKRIKEINVPLKIETTQAVSRKESISSPS